MNRRSLSYTFGSLLPFSKRKNGLENTTDPDDRVRRKISVDHTVLSSSTTSHDFSRRSYDVDCYETVLSPSNFATNNGHATQGAYGGAAAHHEQGAVSSMRRLSSSEPSLQHIQHPQQPTGLCSCPDCYAPPGNGRMARQDQPLRYSGSSLMPSHNNNQQWTSAPTHFQQPTSSSPKPNNTDPALQARIEAIRIQQQLLGDNHPDVIFALSNLARLHQRRGNHAEAADILKESQMRSAMAKSTPQFSPSTARPSFPQEQGNVPGEISFTYLNDRI